VTAAGLVGSGGTCGPAHRAALRRFPHAAAHYGELIDERNVHHAIRTALHNAGTAES
jgi:hypothetical protein